MVNFVNLKYWQWCTQRGRGRGRGPRFPHFCWSFGGNKHFCRSFGEMRGRGTRSPTFAGHLGEMSTFLGHSVEMSHSPYLTLEIKLHWGNWKTCPPPLPMCCTRHWVQKPGYQHVSDSCFEPSYISAQVRVFFSQFLMGGRKIFGPRPRRSPTETKSDRGNLAEKIRLKPKLPA